MTLYGDQIIDSIWDAKSDWWALVEGAWILATTGKRGKIPSISINHTIQGHEAVEWLKQASRRIPHDQSVAIHKGMCSSDLMDSSCALMLDASRRHILQQLQNLYDALATKSTDDQLCAGRTHGQYASMVPRRHYWAAMAESVQFVSSRLGAVLIYGKISGPLGNDNVPASSLCLRMLGLMGYGYQLQAVDRNRWAGLWTACVQCANICDKIASDMWLWARSGATQINLGKGQTVGSSSMPHKRNPTRMERISGLSAVVRCHSFLLMGCGTGAEYHDLRHSSAERMSMQTVLSTISFVIGETGRCVASSSLCPATKKQLRSVPSSGRLLRESKLPYHLARKTTTCGM